MASASQALAAALARNLSRHAPELAPKIVTTTATLRSDHASFWAYGYPAVLLIEDWDEFTPHYHTVYDTQGTLDPAFHTAIVRATVATLAELAGILPHDLSPSHKAATFVEPLFSTLAYTISLHNRGWLTATAILTDVMPSGLTLTGAIEASHGVATWLPPILHWQGEVGRDDPVTIAYRALVAARQPGGTPIRNTALVDDGAGRLHALTAELRAPWWVALPLVFRGP